MTSGAVRMYYTPPWRRNRCAPFSVCTLMAVVVACWTDNDAATTHTHTHPCTAGRRTCARQHQAAAAEVIHTHTHMHHWPPLAHARRRRPRSDAKRRYSTFLICSLLCGGTRRASSMVRSCARCVNIMDIDARAYFVRPRTSASVLWFTL